MRYLTVLLFSFGLHAAGTFTSVKTGDWMDPTVWGFAAGAPVCHTNVPCMADSGDAGDVVVLGLGFVVTCSSGETCSAGNKTPGNVAVDIASGTYSNTTTQLVVASGATLIYGGAVKQNKANWTLTGTVICDTSWLSTATTELPAWQTSSATGNGGRITMSHAAPNGTSTTSQAITTGSVTLTTQAGLGYATNQRLKVTSNVSRSKWMSGAVTSYSGTTLVLNVDYTWGTGTYSDWLIGPHSLWVGAGNSAANAACNNNACRSGEIGHDWSSTPLDIGTFTCAYSDFIHIGTLVTGLHKNSLRIEQSNDNISFDHCSLIDSAAVWYGEGTSAGTGSFAMNGFQMLAPVTNDSTNSAFQFTPAATEATATRTVTNSYFEGAWNGGPTGYQATALTITNSMFRDNPNSTGGPSVGLQFAGAVGVNTDQILVLHEGVADYTTRDANGPIQDHWVIARYIDSTLARPHLFLPVAPTGTGAGTVQQELRNLFIEHNANVGSTWTFIIPPGNMQSGASFSLHHSILSCSPDGTAFGAFLNNSGGTSATAAINYYNLTYCSTAVGTNATWGIGQEVGTSITGTVLRVDSNLVYRMDVGGGFAPVMWVAGNGTLQAGAYVNVGWNAIYNNAGCVSSGCANNYTANYYDPRLTSGAIGTGPANDYFAFSVNGTPGTLRPPIFSHETLSTPRRLINFDTGFLGLSPSPTTWTAGVTYNTGDVVKDSQGTMYGGSTFNWRFFNGTGCTALASSANRPLTGSAWVECWEPASAEMIKALMLDGATYNDPANNIPAGSGVIGALNGWVRTAFAPSGADATALRTAGKGGTYIGAMAPATGTCGTVLFPLPSSVCH